MARIVLVGGGVVGLSGALLLARDGHDVTVLERDPAPPPDPQQAWSDWERKGVNQFRLLHYFAPRFREVMETNAPEVVRALEAAGALCSNPFRSAPAEITGGFRETDARYDAVTARRPVAEAAIAGVVDATDNLTVRRGVAVTGLLTGDATREGVPHVVGVRTDAGDDVFADVVIDAGGRRSTLPTLLTDIGARAPVEEKEDCGFVYFGRHFRSSDGSLPVAIGPLLMAYESLSILTLPADNGTWGIGLVASAKDPVLRRLKDADTWTSVVKGFPLVAHWLDGEPLEDHVSVMAKIEDRHRSFVIDGEPVATGVLALADSWACTNPSVGRGISIGAIHAAALRDLLHDAPSDPIDLATGWHDATLASVESWYRGTLAFDTGRLDQIHAEIEGRAYEAAPEFEMTCALQVAAMKDPELLRNFLEIAGVLTLPDEVMARPGVFERVIELGGGWRDEPLPGLTREELVAVVGS
jgi:2-polyprenyl-6-methoxyphenol hydroxylase-like FAD-dependent oxidoreductase